MRVKPENMKALDAIISDWTRGFDATALETLVRAGEVPTSRVYTIADIYADPQFKARDMLLQVPHATLGYTTQSGVVPRLSATPGSVRHSGPDLGADGVDILRRELGKCEQEIETLRSGGAVCLHQPV